MPTQANLMGSGCPALQAQASVGIIKTGLTALGSSQGTALALPSDFNVFSTVAASTGAILAAAGSTGNQYQPCDSIVVVNHGANALSVYPPTGGTIGTAGANAALSVPAGKTAYFTVVGANAFAASVSA